ncbi:MAG: calcium-binding protein [Neisseria sp.]|nr:calcium-binding protein [Neisseria sp.]
MGMFDYKEYSGTQAADLLSLSKQLAVHGTISGVMGLPMETLVQSFADAALSGGFYPNPVDVRLPESWREITPTQLNLPADTLDSYGYYPIASPITGMMDAGPQAKILGNYDEGGKLTQISVVFAGTNSLIDVLDYLQMNENTIAPNMDPLLTVVKDFALANGLSGQDVLVTGYSLGGGMTNIMAKNRESLADGFFNDALYIGHAAPYIYENGEVILNMGYENDAVYRIVGNESNLWDALKAAKPGLVNPDANFDSSIDNIVLFNDIYASPIWNISPFSIANFPVSWQGHVGGILTDAIDRIADSAFYEYTARDSTVIVSNLSALSRNITWVEDKQAQTSNHFGTPAFMIGTQYNDLIKGGSNGDYIDGGAGDDTIKTGSGADRIEGGTGTDTLILDGNRHDWDVYRSADGTLFFNPHDGSGLKQASGIEQVAFTHDLLSLTRQYTVGENGLGDERHTLFTWLNQDIAYRPATFGSAGDDNLSGAVVFADDGNDVLHALSSGSLLHGGEGHDILRGGTGNDSLYGAEGNDLLIAGGGHDTLYGGVGHDRFLFDGTAGQAVIKDFNAYAGDKDLLMFTDVFADADALAAATHQNGKNVVIDYGQTSIVVENTAMDDLLAHTVLLVA